MRVVRRFARKRLVPALVAGIGAASSMPFDGWAGDLGFGLGYTLEYSTNIARTPADEQDEWTHSALVGFSYLELTPEIGARVRGIAEYRYYANDTFEDEAAGTADALILWSISPQQFTWTVEDAYRQVQIDPTQPNTPGNRSGSNAFSTGPDAYVRMTTLDTLQLGGRYGSVMVEESTADSTSVLGYASWLHKWTPSTTMSLNYHKSRIDNLDETVFPDYTRQDGFLGIGYRQPVSELTLNVGITRIEPEGQPDKTGDLLHLTWLARLSSVSSIGITAHEGFSDTGTGLLSASRQFTEPSDVATAPSMLDIVVSSDLFFERSVDGFYSYSGSRFSWNVFGFWRDLDFETTAEDREETGARFELRHATSPDLDSSLLAGAQRTKFYDTGREDDDRAYGLRFNYRVGFNALVGLEVGHVSRDSSDPAFSYDENRAMLWVYYNTNPRVPVFRAL